jgi:hypothetical protein
MHMDNTGGAGSPFTAQLPPERQGRNGDGERTSRDLDGGARLPAQIAAIVAENYELKAELERLRAERARMVDVQNRLMDAIGCKSADRLVHDVRNVLNERELYRALADTIPD